MQQIVQDSVQALPLLGWAVVGLLVLCVEMIFRRAKLSAIVGVAGLLVVMAVSIAQFDSSANVGLFFGSVAWDSFSQFFNLLSLVIALSVVLMSLPGVFDRTEDHRYEQFPEFLMCIIFGGFGASVATSASDLTSFFIGFETLSIALYGLCGFYRTDMHSTESAFKYLLLGSFSTVTLLFGLSLLYGATGSTNYADIARTIAAGEPALLVLSLLFLVAGFAFKLALVPFHLYTPDVYEGAPTPITAYLATISKVAAIGASLRIFWGLFGSGQEALMAELWQPLWLALCLCSIILGSIAALQQRSLKKIFAFSSISHAGFLGLGLLVAGPVVGEEGVVSNITRFSLLTYLSVYSVMSLGVFAIIHRLEKVGDVLLLDDLKGLGEKRLGLSLAFGLLVLGMAGIPPFAGFMIKFWLLQELVLQGHVLASIFAVLGTLIGMAYYLRILIHLFMGKEGRALSWNVLEDRVFTLRAVSLLAIVLTLVGGIFPSLYADWIFQTLGLK
jgi:NADH-quinone oxidoreductase subunit N